MAKTKIKRRGSWSLNSDSDSSESEISSSVVSSSEEEPPVRKKSSRNNRSSARKSRRALDPESEPAPSRKSSKTKPKKDKKSRKSGYEYSSSDTSSDEYNTDDSSSDDDRPFGRKGKPRTSHQEFGDPRSQKKNKETDDDTESKSSANEDDSNSSGSMKSPPKKTATKLNKYVEQNPDRTPADVENQYDDDEDGGDSSERKFNNRKLNAIPEEDSSTSTPMEQRPNNPAFHSVPRNGAKETNTDDNSDEEEDDESDDDKPIPERRRFLTRERKIITCLTLGLCCLCLAAALGIGIGIGLASRDIHDHVVPVQSGVEPTPPPNGNGTQSPTIQPSPPPDTTLLQLLIDNSFDEGSALSIEGTPQRSAYEWLSRNAELPNYTNEVKLARYALATFYFSTNGPSTWAENIRNGGWMTDVPECEWASTARNQCTGAIYSSLTLDFVGVSGEIPPELAYLTGLTRLSLRSEGAGSQSIAGSLPSTIGLLKNLQTIRLNENNIGGSLPTTIGSLTNVRVFLMSGNSLEGSIPSEIGRTMGNTFNFDRNRLTGRLPVELFRMGTLTALNFEDNTISGQIPRDIGMNPSLNSVNFSSNRLTGTIPTELGRLVTMRSGINLSNNQLSGVLPSEIGFLVDMQNLQLNNNRLIGRVPRQYDAIRDMRLLRIDGNLLTGEMPTSVCDSFTDRTISYSDCGTQAFQCPCCTFCCIGSSCTCNVDDESICNGAVPESVSMESDQTTLSGLYYSETEENKGKFFRDSSRRILASMP
ncbi:unnamed protein product [Cylindrotheca closterium]|uniref:L domain-like protein n=1 Tax=Cylindrotheca closterium TaxID=2856 RepID=A0AAD2CDF8_9STRA|nr:unnamed protein product [Cylindrotheca closterium]